MRKTHKIRALDVAHAHARRALSIGSGADVGSELEKRDNTTIVLDESKLKVSSLFGRWIGFN